MFLHSLPSKPFINRSPKPLSSGSHATCLSSRETCNFKLKIPLQLLAQIKVCLPLLWESYESYSWTSPKILGQKLRSGRVEVRCIRGKPGTPLKLKDKDALWSKGCCTVPWPLHFFLKSRWFLLHGVGIHRNEWKHQCKHLRWQQLVEPFSCASPPPKQMEILFSWWYNVVEIAY